jgi:hypothetical protein
MLRPRFVGSGARRSAKSLQFKAFRPSNVPGIVSSSKHSGRYNMESILWDRFVVALVRTGASMLV